MNQVRKLFIGVALACALATTPVAFAVPWTFNSVGNNARFGWGTGFGSPPVGQHIEDVADIGAFGTPTVDIYGFHFNNFYNDMNFTAVAGTAQTSVHAGIQVDIDNSGSVPFGAPTFDTITVKEGGTWGGVQSDLHVQADVTVFEYVGFGIGALDLPDVTFHGDGTWDVTYTFSYDDLAASDPDFFFLPIPMSAFNFKLINIIQADGSDPETFISKTYADVYLPEPSTALLMVVFSSVAMLRRRR